MEWQAWIRGLPSAHERADPQEAGPGGGPGHPRDGDEAGVRQAKTGK